MSSEISWLGLNSNKVCAHLRKQIIQTYRYPSWLPGFLRRPITAIRHYFGRYKVIVQLDMEHYYAKMNSVNVNGGILGCPVHHRLDLINSFSTKVSIKTLRKLLAHRSVANIWRDRKVQALLDVATPVVQAPPIWNLGIRGRGVGIAVIDTGISPHPDLIYPKNRIIAFKDFVNGRTKPYDDNGHGTHCAGDAAGNGSKSNGKYRGPATEANLIGVKVLNKQGSGLMSKVLAGVQWCVDNKTKYGIRVISMSLGFKASQSYKKDPVCQALRNAWQHGLVVCVAAGNEGPGAETINSPGTEPSVITVGAMNDHNTVKNLDDSIAGFSSRGPTLDGITKPDLVAPGVNITSLRVSGSYLDKIDSGSRVGTWYTTMSGTSMATPICAGVVALILRKYPNLTPDQVKTFLKDTCRHIGTAPNIWGAGLVNALSAYQRAGQ